MWGRDAGVFERRSLLGVEERAKRTLEDVAKVEGGLTVGLRAARGVRRGCSVMGCFCVKSAKRARRAGGPVPRGGRSYASARCLFTRAQAGMSVCDVAVRLWWGMASSMRPECGGEVGWQMKSLETAACTA